MTVTTDQQKRANLLLAAGRIRAYEKMPYLSAALWSLTAIQTIEVPRAATDERWRMYVNPIFVCTCDVDEVAGLYLHEINHPMRGHAKRWRALNEPPERHRTFNAGADAAINADLRDAGVILPRIKAWYPEMIPGGRQGMTAEQFYRLLIDTPGITEAAAQAPELLILPNALRYDCATPQRILAAARRGIFTGQVTITILGGDGEPIEGVTGPVKVHDRHTITFDLVASLPAGQFYVIAQCGDETVAASLSITVPTIKLRPDHITRGYLAPENIVVEGNDTRFTQDTTVEVFDAKKNLVPDAVSNVIYVSETLLTFNLGQVLDGVYFVKVTTGDEESVASLPVGLPHMDITPAQLPSGHGVPYKIAGVCDDFAFDATSRIEVLDPQTFGIPLPGVTGPLTVIAPNVVNFEVTRTLPDGPYIVEITTGDQSVAATLMVGGEVGGDGDEGQGQGGSGEGDRGKSQSGGDGEGQGGGSGNDSGDGDEGNSSGGGEQDGDGDEGNSSGGGEQDEDGDGDMLPDCGSSTGGDRRPWEAGADQNDDGSVDEGRAERIRQQVARDIKDFAAKGQGKVPGGLERWADLTLEPTVDWRAELRNKTSRVAASVAGRKDYSYKRMSRRAALMPGIILPGMVAMRPPHIKVVLDDSGSVSKEMLSQLVAEVKGALRHTRGTVDIIVCDAKAQQPQRVRDISQIKFVGGGGTDMRIGIAAAAKMMPKADAIITGTDGETDWPTEPPAENPNALYVALLTDDRYAQRVPAWMQAIVIKRRGADIR